MTFVVNSFLQLRQPKWVQCDMPERRQLAAVVSVACVVVAAAMLAHLPSNQSTAATQAEPFEIHSVQTTGRVVVVGVTGNVTGWRLKCRQWTADAVSPHGVYVEEASNVVAFHIPKAAPAGDYEGTLIKGSTTAVTAFRVR